MVITLSCQISYIIMEFAGHISAHVNFLSLFSIDIDQWHHCNDALMVAQTVKHLSTMRETRVRSLGQEDPLEKEMATHCSTIAWKIPWTEEPGRLQSMGSQRVRHD